MERFQHVVLHGAHLRLLLLTATSSTSTTSRLSAKSSIAANMSIRKFLLNIAAAFSSIASRKPTQFTKASQDALMLGTKSHLQSQTTRLRSLRPRTHRWNAGGTEPVLKRVQVKRSMTAEGLKMKVVMGKKEALERKEAEFWDSPHQRLGPWA